MTEDTISRKHLLSEIDELMQSPWFNRYKDDIGVLRHGYIERKEAVEIVRDLCVKAEPSVIPKQRTGTWIGIDGEPHETWACSLCRFVINASHWRNPEACRDSYKYCPGCGAKMEGGTE